MAANRLVYVSLLTTDLSQRSQPVVTVVAAYMVMLPGGTRLVVPLTLKVPLTVRLPPRVEIPPTTARAVDPATVGFTVKVLAMISPLTARAPDDDHGVMVVREAETTPLPRLVAESTGVLLMR
jgi:hypothetical protein